MVIFFIMYLFPASIEYVIMEVNRCIAYTNKNKKCRCKIPSNQLFCSEEHYPINKELVNEGCFMCCEKINSTKEQEK